MTEKTLSLVSGGKEVFFTNGEEMWAWVMLNRPAWIVREKLSDNAEVNDFTRNAKRIKGNK